MENILEIKIFGLDHIKHEKTIKDRYFILLYIFWNMH